MTELLEQFAEHLQGLGYQTALIEGKPLLRAQHEQFLNFSLIMTAGGVLLSAHMRVSPLAKRLDLFTYTNDLNQEAAVTRFLIDKDGDFTAEAWWPPLYERDEFDNFMGAWHRDFTLISSHERTIELLD
jgi:hypothetical protein